MDYWLEWARGPAFVFSFTLMVLGLGRHLALTFWEICRAWRRAGDKTLPLRQIWQSTLEWLLPIKKMVQNPLFSLTSIVFHIAILIVPVFLAGHIALWSRSIGLSWPAIPHVLADILTIVAIAAAGALVVQRVFAKSMRALSRFQDYSLLLVIALPFVSGFLVMHPALSPYPYSSVLFVHVMSANLLMILIPLTKLIHAVLLPGVQLVAEMGWHWPPDAGSKVAAALGKEEARI